MPCQFGDDVVYYGVGNCNVLRILGHLGLTVGTAELGAALLKKSFELRERQYEIHTSDDLLRGTRIGSGARQHHASGNDKPHPWRQAMANRGRGYLLWRSSGPQW
jgi:hypothetical protein